MGETLRQTAPDPEVRRRGGCLPNDMAGWATTYCAGTWTVMLRNFKPPVWSPWM